MNNVNCFKQKESNMRKDLVAFQKGELPYNDLRKSVRTLRQAYDDLRKEPSELRNKSIIDYESAFGKYKDMLLVERMVEIARDYPPMQVETIVGIDGGGRGFAKLVKALFDRIRENQNLPKTKILFISIHYEPLNHLGNTVWDLNYKNNARLEGKEYGNLLIVDDLRATGITKRMTIKGIKSLQEKVNITCLDHVYFMVLEDSHSYLTHTFDIRHQGIFGQTRELFKKDDGMQPPSLFAVADREMGMTKDIVQEINEKIAAVVGIAVKTYLGIAGVKR